MSRTKQYIAYLLLLAFLLPLTLQSIHVLRHQKQKHHCCTQEYHHHHTKNDTNVKGENCPLCDYEFAIPDLPQTSVYRTKIPVITYTFSSIITTQKHTHFLQHQSSRAPPAYI